MDSCIHLSFFFFFFLFSLLCTSEILAVVLVRVGVWFGAWACGVSGTVLKHFLLQSNKMVSDINLKMCVKLEVDEIEIYQIH